MIDGLVPVNFRVTLKVEGVVRNAYTLYMTRAVIYL
jgi:hypothetical protein